MITCLYSMFDTQTELYTPPFYQHNDQSAVRAFTDALNHPDKDTVMSKNPEHFRLYRLGTWDDSNGIHELEDSPTFVIGGDQCTKIIPATAVETLHERIDLLARRLSEIDPA